MEPIDITTLLQAEIDDGEASIVDIEETIASMEEDIYNMRMEISFIEGRCCLACSLLGQMDEQSFEEV